MRCARRALSFSSLGVSLPATISGSGKMAAVEAPRSPAPRGRRLKDPGGRKFTAASLPLPLRAALDRRAAEEGRPLGDLITELLATAMSFPVPDYCRPRDPHPELPLNKAS